MAPENTQHSASDESGTSIPLTDNNVVENGSSDLPHYAYTVNGASPYAMPGMPGTQGMPGAPMQQPAYNPYQQGMPYQQNYGTGYPAYSPAAFPQDQGNAAANQQTPYQMPYFPPQPAQEQTPQANQIGQVPAQASQPTQPKKDDFNYDFITSPARIAIYDNLKSAPRVIQIDGAPTHEYIERIASLTYKHAKEEGGIIPYTVIREVSENFIHARFQEIVVSIMDKGNTIRFADQGPGISNKDLVQEPGFSSATEPMKRYIRGVGSGLPIVRDYLNTTHGYIQIEDNINKGSVVTISLVAARSIHDGEPAEDLPELTDNEERILLALLPDKTLGVTEMHNQTGIAVSSIHTAFSKMEEKGLMEKVNKNRTLTQYGQRVAISLQSNSMLD